MEKIIIASGPVIVRDNKVLLNLHGDTDFWKFCGGRVLPGETLKETAIRRSREESGVDIEITDDKPFLSYAKKETPQGKLDVILVHYLAETENETSPGKDVRESAWHDINNLPENLAPNIIPALKHFGFIK